MNEIKFRGKRADNNKWVYGYYYISEKNESYIVEDYTNNHLKVIPKTVGQYIGLKDKNKIEVYTGDRVYGLADCGNHWGEGIVKFISPSKDWCGNPQFCADWIEKVCNDSRDKMIRLDCPQNVEVIGNIYGNVDSQKEGEK